MIRQNKRGVTLVALAITIIIMLLLAGIVIQMTLGDNGLIAKANQSKIDQAKEELYETARLEYLTLKTKAISKDEEEPPVSEVLSAAGFLAKYDVNGDNITDKKGEVIDTKDNLLAKLSGMAGSGSGGHSTPSTPSAPETPTPQTYPEQSYPKTIDGVTIQEHDKDKMILKINIKEQTKLAIRYYNTYIPHPYSIEVEWGNWGYDTFRPDFSGSTGEHEYYPGEYIMKIKGAKSFSLESAEWRTDKFEVTVLHWGKFEDNENEQNNIKLYSVKDIKMPEPNDVTVTYEQAIITNIPEDLFKYKPTRKSMSYFQNSYNITSVPENLYKYNMGMERAENVFSWCTNITSIPENLFKYNQNLTHVNNLFPGSKATTIPENLFKYNTKLLNVTNIFVNSQVATIPEDLFKYNTKLETISGVCSVCINITNIPENLFKYNTEVLNFNSVLNNLNSVENIPENIFKYNTKALNFTNAFIGNTKLKSIPENVFKYNTKATEFISTFGSCTNIGSIPENIFKYNTEARNFSSVFSGLLKLENIPGNLFDNNPEANDFSSAFSGCIKLTNIPWNIFQNINNNASNFRGTFANCNSLTYLNLPSKLYSMPESQYRGIFVGCTNAHNYSTAPESWINW